MLTLALLTAVVAALRGMWSPCGLSMLSSLNPVSESARGHRFWITAVEYAVGAVAGGALLGAGCAVVAAGIGRVHPAATLTWALVAGAALVGVASDTRVFGRALPEHPRQVDERWLGTYRRWIYATGYGVQIGAGFATYIMTAAVYLTVALAVLTGSPAAALLICGVFGAVRGLLILVAAPARTPERLRAAHRRIAGLAGPSLDVAIALQAAVAAVAGWLVAGPLLGAAALLLAGEMVAVVRRAGRPQPA
jgi:hypothetical protein